MEIITIPGLKRHANGCQIDITNVCPNRCAYCSRLTRHYRPDQLFFMKPEAVAKAVDALKEHDGLIGITGGEPTVHPGFAEIMCILRSKGSPERYGLWTTGGSAYRKHADKIGQTFGYIHINRHTPLQRLLCLHQPLTVAIGETVGDEHCRRSLIDNCWVRKQWGSTIGPKGVFFCEIAHAWDLLLDGPGGFPIESNWWRRSKEEQDAQCARYCRICGMAIPMKCRRIGESRELISPGNLDLFRKHKLRAISSRHVRLFRGRINCNVTPGARRSWNPANFGGPLLMKLIDAGMTALVNKLGRRPRRK